MTLQQQVATADKDMDTTRAQQNDRLMETLQLLSEGSVITRELLNQLLAQYSWDGYINELEFE